MTHQSASVATAFRHSRSCPQTPVASLVWWPSLSSGTNALFCRKVFLLGIWAYRYMAHAHLQLVCFHWPSAISLILCTVCGVIFCVLSFGLNTTVTPPQRREMEDLPKLRFIKEALRADDPFISKCIVPDNVQRAMAWHSERSAVQVRREREAIICQLEREADSYWYILMRHT